MIERSLAHLPVEQTLGGGKRRNLGGLQKKWKKRGLKRPRTKARDISTQSLRFREPRGPGGAQCTEKSAPARGAIL